MIPRRRQRFLSNAEFCFLLQKYPTTGKKFTNRSFGTVREINEIYYSCRYCQFDTKQTLIRHLNSHK
ncbi:MAG: hypothetical protein NY202_04675 [Mollicutes bacterium UO1]